MRWLWANRERFEQLARWVARLEDILLALLLLVMICMAGGQILLRNLFDSGIVWADPLLRVLVLWLGMFGAMAATRGDNHIRIDILSRFLPEHYKAITHVVTSLFTLLVCAVIAWNAVRFVYLEWQEGILLFALVPAWLCEFIIPIGFGMIAFRYLMFTLRDLSNLFRSAI